MLNRTFHENFHRYEETGTQLKEKIHFVKCFGRKREVWHWHWRGPQNAS